MVKISSKEKATPTAAAYSFCVRLYRPWS